jgi:hypothetical protein
MSPFRKIVNPYAVKNNFCLVRRIGFEYSHWDHFKMWLKADDSKYIKIFSYFQE